MKQILFFIFTFIPLLADDISLNGTWQYHIEHEPKAQTYQYQFSNDDPTMTIPNNWYKEGVNHGGVVWFQKKFEFNDKSPKQFLHFKGVDYLCDIWLNDQYIGSHKGYFQHFEFDITDILRDGENILKVKVNSPLENYPENYSLHKTLLRGIFSHHDTRPGTGWSPIGQDRNSGGIWNGVSIKSYKTYKIEQVRVTPQLLEKSVNLSIDLNVVKLKRTFSFFDKELTVTVTPANFKGESYTTKIVPNFTESEALAPNNTRLKPSTPNMPTTHLVMNLPNAKLWTTHDRGFPHLYNITFKIGELEHTIQTGFKSLRQNVDKVHFLNGQTLFIKGTNYISAQYMSEMSEDKMRQDLELMKKAHINAIRVHAHIEPNRFYKLCDEMGFLLWQDYNLQWGYTEDEAFEDEAVKQALEMVDQLYNHPSIYIWSMHNEPPYDSPWMKWKYKDYNPEQNKELDEKLFEAVSQHDTLHLLQKISAGVEHPWFGWYTGKYQDFRNPSKSMIITEYGAQAIPTRESLRKFVPDHYLLPKGKKAIEHWEYHNFQFDWAKKCGVEFKGSLKAFIKDSQTYQYALTKYATEMLRIQKYQHTSAIFQFMFKEGWESMNWGVVDYYYQPKPAYYALQNAFAPIIIVAKQGDDNLIEFYVVNDTLADFKDLVATIEIDGKPYDFTIDVPKDSVVKFAKMNLGSESEALAPNNGGRAFRFQLKLTKESKQIAHNHYEFLINR